MKRIRVFKPKRTGKRTWGTRLCYSCIIIGVLSIGHWRTFAALSPTTTTLTASPSSTSGFGQAVTLTATVNPAAATGKVTFYDHEALLGVAAVSNGMAVLSTNRLRSGQRSLKADYSGDGNYSPSISSNLSFLVSVDPESGFATAVAYGAGAGPIDMVVADFNNDGKADVAVTGFTSSAVSILLGNGDGTFQTAKFYSVGGSPIGIVAADFDGDGNIDLAVSQSGAVKILRGSGSGSFSLVATVTVGSGSQGIAAGDFNRDGKADLVVANNSSNNITVLIGAGDGTFQTSSYNVGSNPRDVAIGDFNGDGAPDIVVSNNGAGTIDVLLGNGDGTFQTPSSIRDGNNPFYLAVADVNGDGYEDVVATDLNVPTSGRAVDVLLGNGDGTFQPFSQALTGGTSSSGPRGLSISDFNGDGYPDIAVANSGSNSISILFGNGDGNFISTTSVTVGSGPSDVAVGDFNGDGAPDLVAPLFNGSSGNSVAVLLGITGVPPVNPDASTWIFIDSLVNGWTNSSSATIDLRNTSLVHAGNRSVRVGAGPGQALEFDHVAFDSSKDVSIVFWINGGASGGQSLQVRGMLAGVPQPPVALAPLAANTWQQISIPLTSLGVASQPNLSGFQIQEAAGASPPAFFVDDVKITAVQVPSIFSLNPTFGIVGASVTISGTHFGTTQGTSTVTFNGVAAAPVSWGAASIVTPVPAGAATGNIVVTVGGQASNSVAFTVAPTITSLSPTSGIVGTLVTIAGSNFGTTQGTSTVTFNGVAAAPVSWSATNITAPVPAGATTGNVVVTVAGHPSNGMPFTVPVIVNMSHDLTRLGIASQNLTPNNPALDARPLFQAALQYVQSNPVQTLTLDKGAYYLLTNTQSNGVLIFPQLSNLTIDLAGSTFYFNGPLIPNGIYLYYCSNLTLTNFQIDYVNPPYTHVALTSVDTVNRLLKYQTLPGWPDPSTFNNLTSPFGGPIQGYWAAIFRNGSIVPGTSRTLLQAPFTNNTITIQDQAPWAMAPTLSTLQAGDTVVVYARGGGPAIFVEFGSGITFSNISIYGAQSVLLTQTPNTTVDGMRIEPRPGSGLLGGVGGIAFTPLSANDHIRNSYVARTIDDAIPLENPGPVNVVSQTGTRQLNVSRFSYVHFPNGTLMDFVDRTTTLESTAGIIVNQQPPDDPNSFPTNVTLTFDRDLPTVAANTILAFGSATDRGQGSTVEDNLIEDTYGGRGVWLSGVEGVTVQRNVIRRTSNAGILVQSSTESVIDPGDDTPPSQNILITDNALEGSLGPAAAGNGLEGSLGAVEVSTTTDPFFAFGTTPSNINVTIQNNYISDSERSGIWIGELNGGTLNNNLVIRYSQNPTLGGIFGIAGQDQAQVMQDATVPVVIHYSSSVAESGDTVSATSNIFAPVTMTATGAPVTGSGGVFSLTVQTAVNGFAWSASSDSPWLTITSPTLGSGAATVQYVVAPNSTGVPRTGHITIGGEVFTITEPVLKKRTGQLISQE